MSIATFTLSDAAASPVSVSAEDIVISHRDQVITHIPVNVTLTPVAEFKVDILRNGHPFATVWGASASSAQARAQRTVAVLSAAEAYSNGSDGGEIA